jgi:hypothetical protein
MKHTGAVLLLWCIAIAVTVVMVRDTRTLTTLAPVYAVCMIGSIMTVRAAIATAQSAGRPPRR